MLSLRSYLRAATTVLMLAPVSLFGDRVGAASLEVDLAFDATEYGGNPPDTMGAAGPDEVVTFLNGGVSVFRKSDGMLLSHRFLGEFWSDAGVASTFDTYDPRVVYDPQSGRFFAVSLNDRLVLDGGGLPNWLFSSGVAFLGKVQTARITGTANAPAIAAGPFLTVAPMPTPPKALQPNATLLDTGDGHFASLVQVGASIWGVHSVTSDAGRAAIRWFEFDANDAAVLQSGVIARPDRDFLYPSIAANPSGAVVIGFSASSASLLPSAFAVLGETIAGVTTFGEPILVRAGSASLSGGALSRFGDYSATVLDPSDDSRFWTFQEIGTPSNVGGVAVASLRVAPEPDAASTALFGGFALCVVASVRARDCGGTRRRPTLGASG